MAALHLGNEGYASDGVNGKVGIGTSSPSEALTVYDTSQVSIGSGKGYAGANEIQIKAPNAVLLGLDSKPAERILAVCNGRQADVDSVVRSHRGKPAAGPRSRFRQA